MDMFLIPKSILAKMVLFMITSKSLWRPMYADDKVQILRHHVAKQQRYHNECIEL